MDKQKTKTKQTTEFKSDLPLIDSSLWINVLLGVVAVAFALALPYAGSISNSAAGHVKLVFLLVFGFGSFIGAIVLAGLPKKAGRTSLETATMSGMVGLAFCLLLVMAIF